MAEPNLDSYGYNLDLQERILDLFGILLDFKQLFLDLHDCNSLGHPLFLDFLLPRTPARALTGRELQGQIENLRVSLDLFPEGSRCPPPILDLCRGFGFTGANGQGGPG